MRGCAEPKREAGRAGGSSSGGALQPLLAADASGCNLLRGLDQLLADSLRHSRQEGLPLQHRRIGRHCARCDRPQQQAAGGLQHQQKAQAGAGQRESNGRRLCRLPCGRAWPLDWGWGLSKIVSMQCRTCVSFESCDDPCLRSSTCAWSNPAGAPQLDGHMHRPLKHAAGEVRDQRCCFVLCAIQVLNAAMGWMSGARQAHHGWLVLAVPNRRPTAAQCGGTCGKRAEARLPPASGFPAAGLPRTGSSSMLIPSYMPKGAPCGAVVAWAAPLPPPASEAAGR